MTRAIEWSSADFQTPQGATRGAGTGVNCEPGRLHTGNGPLRFWFDPQSQHGEHPAGFPQYARDTFMNRALQWDPHYPGAIELAPGTTEAERRDASTVEIRWKRVPGAPDRVFTARSQIPEVLVKYSSRKTDHPELPLAKFGTLFNTLRVEFPTSGSVQDNFWGFLSLHEVGHLVGLAEVSKGCGVSDTIMATAPMPPGGWPQSLTALDIAAMRKLHPPQ